MFQYPDISTVLIPGLVAVFVTAVLAVGFWLWFRRVARNYRQVRGLNLQLFLVKVPREKASGEEKTKTEKEIISVMEQLYASLSGLKDEGKRFFGRPYLVLEIAIPNSSNEIIFYLAAPRRQAEFVEKRINSFFPTASVEPCEDYNIFNPSGRSLGAVLKLQKNPFIPIKTYQNLEADPMSEILTAFSKLEEIGEGAALQILIRPASDAFSKKAQKVAKLMFEGKNFEAALNAVSNYLVRISAVFPPKSNERQPEAHLSASEQEFIKSIEAKASKIAFETNIRILASAEDENRAKMILEHLKGSFTQFSGPNFNGFKFMDQSGRRLRRLIYDFSFRIFEPSEIIILNSEELTSLFHFPTGLVEIPKLKFLKSKFAPPPANLSKEGIVLGKNIYRGVEEMVRLGKDDRRRHLYVIGQTGTGKSVFLKNLIQQDIENGEGVGFLDPHGDAIEAILELVPSSRAEDVVLFDPADISRPIGLNMLEYDTRYPEQKTFIVNELISIFDKLYDLKTTGGPIFEQYTRNALLLLMDDPDEKYTLMEVPKILADSTFRKRLLAKCRNSIVKDFWEKEAEKAGGEAALQNLVPYITSKFNVFIANDYMRPIIGQSQTTINFRQIMDEGKILLVNLSKGRLGDINSSLLGMIIVGKLLMAAFSRIDVAEDKRRDFYLYLDEFQNFSTESIATILAEARKYRLNLIIAHQFIGQLTDKIKNAVFGNVGSMTVFRVGADDAEVLAKQYESVFSASDLINIDNYNAYLKLLIQGQTSLPFNIQTYPPKSGDAGTAAAIRELSRLKYGRPKDEVEREIYTRIK